MGTNQAMWTPNNAWWQQANATWGPMWNSWMQQWNTNQAMWTPENAWWQQANATWVPMMNSWMQQWNTNQTMWKPDNAWWPTPAANWSIPSSNASWWPVTIPTSSESRVLTCVKDELKTVEDECFSVATTWYQIWAKKNYNECFEESKTENGDWETEEAKEHCRAVQMRHMRTLYSDCFISKSRAMDEISGEIQLETLKMNTIEKSEMTAEQKEVALATFYTCIATPWELPYSMYRTENFPLKRTNLSLCPTVFTVS